MCYPNPNGHQFEDGQDHVEIHNYITMPSLVLNWVTVGWLSFVGACAVRIGWEFPAVVWGWLQ